MLDKIAGNLGGNAKIGQKSNFVKLPVRILTSIEQREFDLLVDRILELKSKGGDTSALEHAIDEKVYALYGLTQEEIDRVEGRGAGSHDSAVRGNSAARGNSAPKREVSSQMRTSAKSVRDADVDEE